MKLEKKQILAEGDGRFRITSVQDKDDEGNPLVTRAGVEKVVLSVELTDRHGKKGYIKEHLTGAFNMLWKVESICRAVGKPELCEGDVFNAKGVVGKSGKCRIGYQEAEGNFPERNTVDAYLTYEAEPPIVEDLGAGDDLPF